ncbi:hypothetical protein ACVWYG_001813 [Pedobacter sp. UYEF25]
MAKIPSDKLDNFTNSVAKLAIFINSQSLKMDDQSLNYLANKLKVQIYEATAAKINAPEKKKSTALRLSALSSDHLVDRKIENMEINQRVKFSTIKLVFYQENTIQTIIVANDSLADFRPSFFNRFWLNVLDGWGIFKEFILVLANIWVLILISVAVIFGIKYCSTRRQLTKTI